jgi:hypothetical protein
LKNPHYAWELLQRLEELSLPTGTRLIVGKGLIEEMTGMLVLDKASFFTKYEVLEASNFELARELFYEDGKSPKDLQTATKSYLEVRDKAMQVTNLGTFLSLVHGQRPTHQGQSTCPQSYFGCDASPAVSPAPGLFQPLSICPGAEPSSRTPRSIRI